MNNESTRNDTALPPPDRRTRASDLALGIFTVIAGCCFLGAWMWLKAEPLWAPAQRFGVLFHDVAGLNENAAVYTDGVRIGAVERIKLLGKHKVLVKIKINQDTARVPEGSAFDIHTNGLVGARYVDVILPDPTATKRNLMTPNSVAWGNDPVRPELVVDRLATQVNQLDFDHLQDTMNNGMERMAAAADNVSVLSHKLNPVADRAVIVEGKLSALASELHGTSHRVNKLLNDPTIAHDVKDTLTKLNDMTAHVESSVARVEKMAANPGLREDIKRIVGDARDTVQHVHEMVSDPTFGSEIKSTMTEARSALSRLDLVGRQLNQILSKRAPLLQMLVGRPGKIQNEQAASTSESVPE
jgi:ABC-type transporter Mla subunit MlaD